MEHAQPANLIHSLGPLLALAHTHLYRSLRATVRRSRLLRVVGHLFARCLLGRLLFIRLLRHLREQLRETRMGRVLASRHRAHLVHLSHVRSPVDRLHVSRARHGVQLGVLARTQASLVLHVRQTFARLSSQPGGQRVHVRRVSIRHAGRHLLRHLPRRSPRASRLSRRAHCARLHYGHHQCGLVQASGATRPRAAHLRLVVAKASQKEQERR